MDPPQLSPLQDPTVKSGGHLLTAAELMASATAAGELNRWDLCGRSHSLWDDLIQRIVNFATREKDDAIFPSPHSHFLLLQSYKIKQIKKKPHLEAVFSD